MSRISDIVTQIRTAVYGRDVRTNIADGIEICYSNVQEGKTLAENAATTANNAATNANNKASLANTAATNADTAATNANTAATNANAAASNIDTRIADGIEPALKSRELLGYSAIVLTDANDAEPNSFHYVVTSEMNKYPANMPEAKFSGYLITVRNKAKNVEQYFWRQIATNEKFKVMYYRTRVGTSGPTSGTYGSWKSTNSTGMVENVLGYANTVLDDADNAELNSIYKIFTSDISLIPAHMPCVSGWLITTENKAKGYEQYYYYQFILDTNLIPIYQRYKFENNGSGNWGSWETIPNIYNYLALDAPSLLYVEKNTKGYYIDGNSGAAGAVSGYAYTIIKVTPGQVYTIKPRLHVAFFTSQSNIGHSTAGYISGGTYSGDVTVPSSAAYMTVSFSCAEMESCWVGLKTKYHNVSIGKKLTDAINNVVRVELDGSGDFTKLTDALAYGMEHKNTTIYLGPGTYDIISELGSSYFENFVYAAYTNMGPKIGNGTHLICSQKSKIVCHYTGSNQEVEMGFSPFNPSAENSPKGIGDYIIEGATIEASRVRYIVHDDIGIQTIPYKHEYIRCNMALDNTNNTHHTHAHSLGGGMGIDGVIVVKDCVFGGVSSDNAFVAWHNDNYTQQQMGYLDISGCYFRDANTIQIRSIGTWPDKTPCLIHDNSLGAAIDYGRSSGGTIDNFEVLAWNNEIRSN